MPAPKGNKYAEGGPGGGRKTTYLKRFVSIAEKLCKFGATDQEIADAFGVSVRTIYNWKSQHEEFAAVLKPAKDEADARVERSLYARALGYEHSDVDIRVIDNKVVETPITKYYPPDTTAAIFWLKNRRSQDWRDRSQHEHTGANGGPIQMQFAAVDADL